ncbi:MAG: hypothetical protein ACK5QX_06475, partial [bacterium]
APVYAECPGPGCPAVDDEVSFGVGEEPDFSDVSDGFVGGVIGGLVGLDPNLYGENNLHSNLCSEIGSATTGNDADPTIVLREQFCVARNYAKVRGLEIISKTAGFSPEEIPDKCAVFVSLTKEYIETVSTKPRDEVLKNVSFLVGQSGMAHGELEITAKACLGLGYATNNDHALLGAVLVLAALGHESYSELIGYMLFSGYGGVSQRPHLALPWYELSLDDLADGGSTSLAPNMPDRAALIRKAVVAAASETKSTGKEAPAAVQ